ncbi:hypothetical protein POV27_19775 [Aureisphaera galaxeae]|uniref:hypothetical protein n=1 Tax=Aureisphaera galaxeae TaxID=1538023 RepID=UPI00235098D1|nr:hypothetical protein [Aureisphaera galaxeae]MDC8006303.1 hypothetical protein [Aureisphaera galaxeae]
MIAKIISYVFRAAVAAYTLLSGYYFLRKPGGGGDEALFMSDLALIASQGWWAAIEKGISIPYMILSYPLSTFLEPHIALRTVNVLLFGGLLFYFYKRLSISNLNFYGLVLFFFSTVGYFMAGTNDTLFVVSLIIFMVETYVLLKEENRTSLLWWGVALVMALLTRKVIFIYLPVVLLSILFLWKYKKGRVKTLLIPALVLALGLGLNAPSLKAGKGLSYDQKLPPEGITATWPQRQYLAQLMVNEGALPNYNHPNWKQTDAYLNKHGKEALPSTILEGMLHDPMLTVKEFFKDFIYSVTYGSRQLGLILPTLLVLSLLGLYRIRKFSKDDYIPWSLLLMLCVFSLIIISFVELRWLAPIFIVSIFYFYRLSETPKIPKALVLANYAFMVLLSGYGMYGLIGKL